MKYLQPKSPDNTRFYSIDYSNLLSGDSIVSATVETATGTSTITRTVFNSVGVGFMIEGGLAGATDTYTIVLNTQAGQIFNDTASLMIVSNEDSIDFSVVTKATIVEFAFEDLRTSGYLFDHSADEISAMLKRLDALMRTYRLKGINTGYNMPSRIGLSAMNDIAGIEDGLAEPIATLLAAAFMEGLGKSLTPNFIRKRNEAYNFIYSYCRGIPSMTLSNTPRGAGAKLWSIYFPFIQPSDQSLQGSLLNTQFIGYGIWDQSIWG